MAMDTPAGFEPAKLTDGGRIRMDPDADDYMRRLQLETGTDDGDVPGMLHQLREEWCERHLDRMVRYVESLADKKQHLVKKRGSRCRTLNLQERDDLELRQKFYRLSKAAAYLADDGKDVMQVILITEKEKADRERAALEAFR